MQYQHRSLSAFHRLGVCLQGPQLMLVQAGLGHAFVRMHMEDSTNTLLQQDAGLKKGGACPLSFSQVFSATPCLEVVQGCPC